jgi:hypothetical protein
MYCFFFAHICQLANVGKALLQKHPKHLKTLIKQGFFLFIKILKKTPNQLARIGRQPLPPFTILHSEL